MRFLLRPVPYSVISRLSTSIDLPAASGIETAALHGLLLQSQSALTQLRPALFASYIAWSALANTSTPVMSALAMRVRPMLAVALISRPS